MKILFAVFLFCSLSCSKKDDTTTILGIQPYENFSKDKSEKIAKIITDFYGVKTVILSKIDLPKAAFVNLKSPRFRADSIIKFQKTIKNDSLEFILGLTIKDISVTKHDSEGNILKPEWKYNDFGVMGLAYCPGNSAIISSFRLKNKDKKIEFERLQKVVIHEFGHNLGLPHCPNKNCVMTSAAEKIATIDNEKMELCGKCKKQLGI